MVVTGETPALGGWFHQKEPPRDAMTKIFQILKYLSFTLRHIFENLQFKLFNSFDGDIR
jgi:hypothetical protein